ncbi:major facilitator superfamily domain-containing protein [Terfezia claveryi]|nr:major facilitator superfamily domain-containing protein [Terfezia claveryi]
MVVLSTHKELGLSVVEYEGEQDRYLLEEESDDEIYEEKLALEARRGKAEGSEGAGTVSRMQLGLIYSLHLAEAIVASSLQPQLYMLLRDEKLCGDVNSVYWTGVVETVFAIGSIAGLFWGWLGDRLGRRPVALAGMVGMAASCFAMGFSTGIVSCALIRGFAGLMGSSMRVMVWTMLGDVSDTSKAKARNFSRMPLVATGGIIGPLLQALLANRFSDSEVWKKFPILSSQLACAGLMVLFFCANFFFLKETLPSNDDCGASDVGSFTDRYSGEYSTEKDTFLGQKPSSPTEQYTTYTYSYNDKPKPLGFSAAIRAPSLLVLLASFSFLCLHSASFDQLLPLLGNASIENGGLGLRCSFLSLVVLGASSSAAVIVYTTFSKAVERVGLLRLYRVCCWLFPLIYVLTPILSALFRSSQTVIAISSAGSIFTKTLVTSFAQTLVVFLVTNASPDAYSLGSIMGLMHSASVFRGFAVAGTGAAWLLGGDDGEGMGVMGLLLWCGMAGVAVCGAVTAWFVKERARVNRDWMASALKWEICYENDSWVMEEEEGRRESRESWGDSEFGSDAESIIV